MLGKMLKRGGALASAMVALGLLHGTAAMAQYNDYSYVRVFYTDGTRQQVAGRETVYCDGRTESFGYETIYFRYYNGMCP